MVGRRQWIGKDWQYVEVDDTVRGEESDPKEFYWPGNPNDQATIDGLVGFVYGNQCTLWAEDAVPFRAPDGHIVLLADTIRHDGFKRIGK